MKQNGDAGFASIQFLFLLVFLSALTAGTGMLVSAALKLEGRFKKTNLAMAEINRILAEIMADLRADPSPGVNGPGDPVFAWRGKQTGAYRVHINSLSDRLNPNFIRKNVFEKTGLSLLFNPGKNAGALQQFREDRGLFLNPHFYGEFFSPPVYEKYFSGYGWGNINLIDEFAARSLALAITGSASEAEALREKVQTLLINRQLVSPGDLPLVLGSSYDALFPYINAEPLLNVNEVEALLLRELLAYPDYGIRDPEAKCREILERRSAGPLDAGELHQILGIDAAHPLYHYLGAVTWFWEVTIDSDTTDGTDGTGAPGGSRPACRAVICRLPSRGGGKSEPAAYALIERSLF
jgi:hypothetical protein